MPPEISAQRQRRAPEDHDALPVARFTDESIRFVACRIPPCPANLPRAQALQLARRAQFAAGRRCARAGLRALGGGEIDIPTAADRSPVWPQGVVGSITHTSNFAAAALARASQVRSLGIDLEPVLSMAAHADVVETCLNAAESAVVAQAHAPLVAATVVFSAKEALYKCLHPIVRRLFDFEHVETVALCLEAGRAVLRLLVPLSTEFSVGYEIESRFVLWRDHVLTTVELPARVCH